MGPGGITTGEWSRGGDRNGGMVQGDRNGGDGPTGAGSGERSKGATTGIGRGGAEGEPSRPTCVRGRGAGWGGVQATVYCVSIESAISRWVSSCSRRISASR